jgi:hypothetical protein
MAVTSEPVETTDSIIVVRDDFINVTPSAGLTSAPLSMTTTIIVDPKTNTAPPTEEIVVSGGSKTGPTPQTLDQFFAEHPDEPMTQETLDRFFAENGIDRIDFMTIGTTPPSANARSTVDPTASAAGSMSLADTSQPVLAHLPSSFS